MGILFCGYLFFIFNVHISVFLSHEAYLKDSERSSSLLLDANKNLTLKDDNEAEFSKCSDAMFFRRSNEYFMEILPIPVF